MQLSVQDHLRSQSGTLTSTQQNKHTVQLSTQHPAQHLFHVFLHHFCVRGRHQHQEHSEHDQIDHYHKCRREQERRPLPPAHSENPPLRSELSSHYCGPLSLITHRIHRHQMCRRALCCIATLLVLHSTPSHCLEQHTLATCRSNTRAKDENEEGMEYLSSSKLTQPLHCTARDGTARHSTALHSTALHCTHSAGRVTYQALLPEPKSIMPVRANPSITVMNSTTKTPSSPTEVRTRVRKCTRGLEQTEDLY